MTGRYLRVRPIQPDDVVPALDDGQAVVSIVTAAHRMHGDRPIFANRPTGIDIAAVDLVIGQAAPSGSRGDHLIDRIDGLQDAGRMVGHVEVSGWFEERLPGSGATVHFAVR